MKYLNIFTYINTEIYKQHASDWRNKLQEM